MDVDKASFYPLLFDILTDISTAHFVTVDLELSGIPSKNPSAGRHNLQQRYTEVKEAAERYQILQIGITCVQQDVDEKKYTLQPYNFDLSPLIEEQRLDIERIFSFQSGAAEFLLKAGFDIGRPFHSGVPYLSRAESREAREKHAKRQERGAVPDILIKPTETESLAFLEDVRTKLKVLKSSGQSYVNIGPGDYEEPEKDGNYPDELSRYEKRLVHQLVRAEYPELVTISKRGHIQVVRFNKEREDRIQAERTRELEQRINKQKGFRWIIDALLGRDVSILAEGIDLHEVARDVVTGEYKFTDQSALKAQLHRAAGMIKGNPKVLIGHNCFLDLVYIYRTFIGPLPESVVEYQKKLHELWPTIVDTKYMSTHNCGDISPVSSLAQIADQLNEQALPLIEVDEQHDKYEENKAFHEAGYDSFLTAQIAVRLSSSLDKQNDDDAVSDATTVRADDRVITVGMEAMSVEAAKDQTPLTTNGINGTHHTEPSNSEEAIETTEQPTGFTPSIVGERWKGRGDTTIPTDPNGLFPYNPRDRKRQYKPLEPYPGFEGGMPRFNSEFWCTYGNKLRVFGTEEGVCILDGSEASGGEEEDDGGVSVECP